MSVTITDQDIADLVVGTLQELGRLKFNQIATRLQNYEVMGRLMKRDKVQFDSGIGIRRTIMVDHSSAAKMVGLYEPDAVNVADVLQTISVPWRHTTSNYGYERRELLMNRGVSRIVDIMKVRRADGLISLAELMESQFWGSYVDDELHVYSLPYWVTHVASQGGAFAGGDPVSGGAGGLPVATASRWQNWVDDFAAVTKADLITKMRTAYRNIRFKSPVDIADYRKGAGDQYRIYCNEPTMQGFENLGEAQNENLGRDVASMDGVMTFRRNPIVWVPKLDANTSGAGGNPVYMLNFGYFYPVFLKGDYLRETEPQRDRNKHNVWAVHIDLTWNLLCTDRRCQAVIANTS